MVIAVGMNARTYTHTFKSGDLTLNNIDNVVLGSVSYKENDTTVSKDIVWQGVFNSTHKELTWSNNNGVQFGSKKNGACEFTLTTSTFSEINPDVKIKSVTVYSLKGSSGDAVMTIEVGDSQQQFELEEQSNAYTFECDEQGEIRISWKATKRAYYISGIVVKYTLPAHMIRVEEAKFKYPTDKVYADQLTMIAGVIDMDRIDEINADADLDVVAYYTLDGTLPSHEDYNSDPRAGTTESTRGCQINPVLQDTIGVYNFRILMVETDLGEVYESEIAEATYIISNTTIHIPATDVANGNRYAFVANDSVADAFVPSIKNGFLESRTIKKHEKSIETIEYNDFRFTVTDGGYTIQDAADRYMYINGTSNEFYFSAERPAAGAVWSVTVNSDGKAVIKNGDSTIYYVAADDKFGCYATAEEGMELPVLYTPREYPKATITPGNGRKVKGLQEITITCEEGISVSSDFTLKAVGNQDKNGNYEINATYKCVQVDANTLKFTIDTPLKSENNINVNIVITGDIYLNPDGMKYPLPITGRYTRTICTYNHLGDAAPAVITAISPANNSTVDKLSHFVFTFSNYSGHTSLQPRLYAEGKTWTYAIEQTTDNGNGGMIDMMQLALKTTEPLLGNGTYYFEFPTGYFTDCNGNEIEGFTLRYTVSNDSGLLADIEDIDADSNGKWTVYTTSGVKILETTDATDLKGLAKGIYIINAKTVYIK